VEGGVAGRREAERAMDEVRARFGRGAIRAGAADADPTATRSTTTFVPADLS
jgi:DNA polymerase-4